MCADLYYCPSNTEPDARPWTWGDDGTPWRLQSPACYAWVPTPSRERLPLLQPLHRPCKKTHTHTHTHTSVRNFCLPLLAVRVIAKTLSTRVYVIALSTVAAVKRWIQFFEHHNPRETTRFTFRIWSIGSITFGKSRSAARFNYFVHIEVSGGLSGS